MIYICCQRTTPNCEVHSGDTVPDADHLEYEQQKKKQLGEKEVQGFKCKQWCLPRKVFI